MFTSTTYPSVTDFDENLNDEDFEPPNDFYEFFKKLFFCINYSRKETSFFDRFFFLKKKAF